MDKEKKIKEWFKCKKSFSYFCKNYVMIELPGETVIMDPYGAQLRLIDFIDQWKYVIILKSRQIGISTIVQAYIVWLLVFYKNCTAGVISKDVGEATAFAKVCSSILDNLPAWMKPTYTKHSEQSFILSNGSKLYVSAIQPSNPQKTFRGRNITFLVLDEAAHTKYIKEAWVGMSPALVTNQRNARKRGVPYGTIILSTPNKTTGTGAWFYSRYKAARRNEDIFKSMKIHWNTVEEIANDPTWYQTQCQLLGNDIKLIEQELNLKFISGDGAFLPETTVLSLQSENYEPVNKITVQSFEGWFFQTPDPNRYYITGVDTAPEHGFSMSTIEVFDYVTMDQVFEFQAKLSVTDFSNVVKSILPLFPGCVVVENNSYGNQVMESIKYSDFANMLYFEKKANGRVTYGLSNNSKTRPLMIDALYSYITQFPESIKSERLKLELIGLVEKSGRVEAEENERDDLALASSFCYYVRKYDPPTGIQLTTGETLGHLKDILSWNEEGDLELDNSQIIKKVKENFQEYGGYQNIVDFSDLVRGVRK